MPASMNARLPRFHKLVIDTLVDSATSSARKRATDSLSDLVSCSLDDAEWSEVWYEVALELLNTCAAIAKLKPLRETIRKACDELRRRDLQTARSALLILKDELDTDRSSSSRHRNANTTSIEAAAFLAQSLYWLLEAEDNYSKASQIVQLQLGPSGEQAIFHLCARQCERQALIYAKAGIEQLANCGRKGSRAIMIAEIQSLFLEVIDSLRSVEPVICIEMPA